MKPIMCAWFVPRVENSRQLVPDAGMPGLGRRRLLKGSSLFAAAWASGLLNTGRAAQSEAFDFNAATVDEALQVIAAIPLDDGRISLTVPEVSENGAIVAVSVSCEMAGVREIAIVAEPNPERLAATFDIPADTQAFVSTRIKVAQSGRIYAIVKSDGKYYSTFRKVDVTVGGCA